MLICFLKHLRILSLVLIITVEIVNKDGWEGIRNCMFNNQNFLNVIAEKFSIKNFKLKVSESRFKNIHLTK